MGQHYSVCSHPAATPCRPVPGSRRYGRGWLVRVREAIRHRVEEVPQTGSAPSDRPLTGAALINAAPLVADTGANPSTASIQHAFITPEEYGPDTPDTLPKNSHSLTRTHKHTGIQSVTLPSEYPLWCLRCSCRSGAGVESGAGVAAVRCVLPGFSGPSQLPVRGRCRPGSVSSPCQSAGESAVRRDTLPGSPG